MKQSIDFKFTTVHVHVPVHVYVLVHVLGHIKYNDFIVWREGGEWTNTVWLAFHGCFVQ